MPFKNYHFKRHRIISNQIQDYKLSQHFPMVNVGSILCNLLPKEKVLLVHFILYISVGEISPVTVPGFTSTLSFVKTPPSHTDVQVGLYTFELSTENINF